jgi:ketosteroid isomerase-like protein
MEPQRINELFERAYNARDLEQMMLLYEPDAVLVNGPAAEPAVGTSAIRESLAGFIALGGSLRLVQRRFCLVHSDFALISIDFALTAARAPDGSPLELSGTTVELARRQSDGTWKYLIDLPFAGPGLVTR